MYTLFNKQINKCLIHPRRGLWCVEDLEEAKKMLAACQACALDYGLKKEDFIIIDVDTKEVVKDD